MITELEHRLLMTKVNTLKEYSLQLENMLKWVVDFIELGDVESRPVELKEWLAAVHMILETK